MTQKTGTKEWSTHSANCVFGCSHDCLYCYAAYSHCVRWKNRPREDWGQEVVNEKAADKSYAYADGVTMFPTTHDITPNNRHACETVLRKLLQAGRRVLVVSKPHLHCVKAIIDMFGERFRGQLELRFSITCLSDEIRAFWEPNAPTIPERIACLHHAHSNGFKTSVSMEPLLEPWNAIPLVNLVTPATTGEIWIGLLNDMDKRCAWTAARHDWQFTRLRDWQCTMNIRRTFDSLTSRRQVRWKDSYQKALGLAGPEG